MRRACPLLTSNPALHLDVAAAGHSSRRCQVGDQLVSCPGVQNGARAMPHLSEPWSGGIDHKRPTRYSRTATKCTEEGPASQGTGRIQRVTSPCSKMSRVGPGRPGPRPTPQSGSSPRPSETCPVRRCVVRLQSAIRNSPFVSVGPSCTRGSMKAVPQTKRSQMQRCNFSSRAQQFLLQPGIEFPGLGKVPLCQRANVTEARLLI